MPGKSRPPRRHHFVPRAYLERWATAGKVFVRRRDGISFEADPRNVAVEVGLYDVAAKGGGKSSEIEDLLAIIDGAAINAIRRIDESGGAPPRGSDDRYNLAAFLAFQFTRTREAQERSSFPQRVLEYAGDRDLTPELVGEYLENVHLRARPRPREAEAAYWFVVGATKEASEPLTREVALRISFMSTRAILPRLALMNWALELNRKGRLMTSDVPLVLWRTPSRKDEYWGMGIDNAEEIRFPLDPWKQLVLSRRSGATVSRMSGERVRNVNGDVAAGCYEMLIGRPDHQQAIRHMPLAKHRPVARFNIGRGYEVSADGQRRKMKGEVIHFWVPRR